MHITPKADPQQRVQQAIDLGMKVSLRCETETELWGMQALLDRLKAPSRVKAVLSPSQGPKVKKR